MPAFRSPLMPYRGEALRLGQPRRGEVVWRRDGGGLLHRPHLPRGGGEAWVGSTCASSVAVWRLGRWAAGRGCKDFRSAVHKRTHPGVHAAAGPHGAVSPSCACNQPASAQERTQSHACEHGPWEFPAAARQSVLHVCATPAAAQAPAEPVRGNLSLCLQAQQQTAACRVQNAAAGRGRGWRVGGVPSQPGLTQHSTAAAAAATVVSPLLPAPLTLALVLGRQLRPQLAEVACPVQRQRCLRCSHRQQRT